MNKTIIFLSIIAFLLIIISALLVSGKASTERPNNEPKESGWLGQKAPDFELEDFGGNKINLTGLRGKNVVLFFSEGLMCYPACWDQMAKLGSDPRFNNEDTVTYSVIMDQKSEWQRAFDKMPQLRQTKVLFDIYGTASRSYKTLDLTSSMHRGRMPGHTYFLIDKEGVIRYFLDDPQMGLRNEVLAEEIKKIE